jgi:hypothetical protein
MRWAMAQILWCIMLPLNHFFSSAIKCSNSQQNFDLISFGWLSMLDLNLIKVMIGEAVSRFAHNVWLSFGFLVLKINTSINPPKNETTVFHIPSRTHRHFQTNRTTHILLTREATLQMLNYLILNRGLSQLNSVLQKLAYQLGLRDMMD